MNAIILATLVSASLLGGGSDWSCYDPGGYCGECPCEDACYDNSDCPPGSFCRNDRTGPSSCSCVFFNGSPAWTESLDIAPRCEVAGVSPGEQWFALQVLDILDGDISSRASQINNSTQIVGVSGGSAVFWEDGAITELADPQFGVLVDINDHGQIVYSAGGDGEGYGTFLMDGPEGEVIRIHDNHARRLRINNTGQVLIGAAQFNGVGEAALWQNGVAVPLSALSDPPLNAGGLNNLGHIAGVFDDGTERRPGLLIGEMLIELGGTARRSDAVEAMNDLDQVVFFRGSDPYDDPDWDLSLWDDGTVTELGDSVPCYPAISSLAINNCGEMLLTLDDARSLPECDGVFPFHGEGYYSPQTGYHPITAVLEDQYHWDDVYISDINDRGQIVGEALVVELLSKRGILISPHPGDLTRDGSIDLNDYARFFDRFFDRFGHKTTDYSILCNRADFDEDADTDLHDFATFQNHFTGPK